MKNKYTIWFVNDYAGAPQIGMEYRHYYLGKELVKMGHDVTIISANYSHLFYELPKKSAEDIEGITYHWIKTFNYGDAHSKKRVFKWFLFALKLLKYIKVKEKPTAIVVSTAAPFAILSAYILAKKLNAQLIFEVKDIWPLSLIELGGFSSSHPFIRLMAWFEKFALKKSDVIVSNLQNYGEHMRDDVGIQRDFVWISNGVDLEELKSIEPLDPQIKEKIPQDKFIIGYAGTVGVANALESFCEAAKILQDNKEILFVIVGEGQEKENLIAQFGELENLLFIDAIPKMQIQSMLECFDICYIGAKKKDIYRYGVSPNKLFEYLYSAKPILYGISTEKSIMDLVKCGLTVESDSSESIVEGVIKLYNMPKEQREEMGRVGKEYVLSNFTYSKLAQKYEKLINKKGE